MEMLGISLTDKCNARCRMCSLCCSPEGKYLLDKDKVKDCILQASKISSIKKIGFTGGEVFLFYDILLECMLYAKNLGLHSTVKTNAFWAKDFKTAREKLSKLADAGLIAMEISTDEFHQEYVPFEYALNAANAAQSSGINSELCVIKTDKWYGCIDKAGQSSYGISFKIFQLVNAGRCKENENICIEKIQSLNLSCPRSVQQATVMYTGDIYNCCGHCSVETDLLRLGNIETDSLAEVIEKQDKNAFLFLLKHKSFDWFIYLATKLGYEVPEKVSSVCELCNFFLSNKDFIEDARPFVEEEAKKVRIRNKMRSSSLFMCN